MCLAVVATCHADLLSGVELSSLMNVSRVNDSGWGNVCLKNRKKTCVGVVWIVQTLGCGYELRINSQTIIGGFM